MSIYKVGGCAIRRIISSPPPPPVAGPYGFYGYGNESRYWDGTGALATQTYVDPTAIGGAVGDQMYFATPQDDATFGGASVIPSVYAFYSPTRTVYKVTDGMTIESQTGTLANIPNSYGDNFAVRSNGQFILADRSTPPVVYFGTVNGSGVAATQVLSFSTYYIRLVCWSQPLSRWMVFTTDGHQWTSTNGTTWADQGLVTVDGTVINSLPWVGTIQRAAVCRSTNNGYNFYALGDNLELYGSVNGLNWTTLGTFPFTALYCTPLSILCANGMIIATIYTNGGPTYACVGATPAAAVAAANTKLLLSPSVSTAVSLEGTIAYSGLHDRWLFNLVGTDSSVPSFFYGSVHSDDNGATWTQNYFVPSQSTIPNPMPMAVSQPR